MAVTVKFNHLPKIARTLDAGIGQAVNQTAAHVCDRAKAAVPSVQHPGPFATGALQAAIHVVTEGHSDYDKAIDEAERIRDGFVAIDDNIEPLRSFVLPPEPLKHSSHHHCAAVVAPLSYAYAVELGGFSDRLGPRRAGPFMQPAAAAEQDVFTERCAAVLRRLESLGKE